MADLQQSLTYLGLPDHLKSTWLRDLRALPAQCLLQPTTGEDFEDRDQC